LGCLKVFPDDSNRAVGMWKCLDLVEIIFRLGDIPALSNQVLTLLRRRFFCLDFVLIIFF